MMNQLKIACFKIPTSILSTAQHCKVSRSIVNQCASLTCPIKRCFTNGTQSDDGEVDRSDGNFFTKTEILEIYKSTFKATYTGGGVDPKGVFTNNEIDMSEIDIFGFDYDYTLACYKETLDYLIYELGRDVLITKYQYPKDIENLEYIPDFAIRGLHYDVENGFLMKIDTFHQFN
ncbi:hypothetical protein SSS_09679 [Sarcoptes scabiei]|nr:hypothetical protein SSS_09679 [Sarcoptes scabiei]